MAELPWLQSMPDSVKGGEDSEYRRRYLSRREYRPLEASSLVAPMSASVSTNSYGKKKAPSPLRAKITGREDGPVGYTGDEAGSGEIDTSVEAGEKTFKDHVNEIYLSAGTVNVLGGKDEAQKKIESLIKNEIDNADKRSVFSLKPITATSSSKAGYESAGVVIDHDTFAKSQGYGTFAEYKAAGAKPNEDLAKSQGFNSFSDYSAAEGKKAADYYATTSTPPVSATTTATGMYKPLSAQALINQGANYLKSTAEGNNPIIQAQKEAASAKTAAETAGGKGELQMRLTQAGTTGGAAEAATSAYDRDARIRASQEQTALTQQGMAQAQAANESLVNLGQAERTYAENQKLNADNLLNSAMSGITNILAANPNATIETNPELRTFLNTIYQQGGGQGDAPADFIANRLATEKQNIDSGYQTRMAVGTTQDIANTFFKGDTTKLSQFSWGGKTGEEAFRNAYQNWMANPDAVTAKWNPTTKTMEYEAKGDHPLSLLLFGDSDEGGLITPPAGTTATPGVVSTGSTVKSGESEYTVLGPKEGVDGIYRLQDDAGNIYIGNYDSTTNSIKSITASDEPNPYYDKDGVQTKVGPAVTQGGEEIYATVAGKNYRLNVEDDGTFSVTLTGGAKLPIDGASIDWEEGDVTLTGYAPINGKIYDMVSGKPAKENGIDYQQVGTSNIYKVGANKYKALIGNEMVDIDVNGYAALPTETSPENKKAYIDALISKSAKGQFWDDVKATFTGNNVPVELIEAAISNKDEKVIADLPGILYNQNIDVSKYPTIQNKISDIASKDIPVGGYELKKKPGLIGSTYREYHPMKQSKIPGVGTITTINGKAYYVKSGGNRRDVGEKFWKYPRTLVALDGSGAEITREYLST